MYTSRSLLPPISILSPCILILSNYENPPCFLYQFSYPTWLGQLHKVYESDLNKIPPFLLFVFCSCTKDRAPVSYRRNFLCVIYIIRGDSLIEVY